MKNEGQHTPSHMSRSEKRESAQRETRETYCLSIPSVLLPFWFAMAVFGVIFHRFNRNKRKGRDRGTIITTCSVTCIIAVHKICQRQCMIRTVTVYDSHGNTSNPSILAGKQT